MKLYNIYRAFKAKKIVCLVYKPEPFKFRIMFAKSVQDAKKKFSKKWKIYKLF